jgi:hypothetical protein
MRGAYFLFLVRIGAIVYKRGITCTSAVSPSGNSHCPFGVQFRKKNL